MSDGIDPSTTSPDDDALHAASPPLRPTSAASIATAALIALIAWIALAMQTDVTIGRMVGRGFTVYDGLARTTSYLTNLTALAAALCFTGVAVNARAAPLRFLRQPAVVTAVVVYLAFVGLAYNVLLRHLWTPSGYRALLNETLHTVLPCLAALYWFCFVPRFTPGVKSCLLFLVYPLAYLFVTLWRGSVSDFYPYWFINADEIGYAGVARNSALLLCGFLLLMAVFIGINQKRAR